MAAWQKNVGAITLFIDDLERSKAFYHRVFDLPVVFEEQNSAVFRFENMLINLLLTPAAHDLIAPAPVAARNTGARFQFTIWVDDVDAVSSELTGRGVQLLNGPQDRAWGQRTACFSDPDGHIWEIAQTLAPVAGA